MQTNGRSGGGTVDGGGPMVGQTVGQTDGRRRVGRSYGQSVDQWVGRRQTDTQAAFLAAYITDALSAAKAADCGIVKQSKLCFFRHGTPTSPNGTSTGCLSSEKMTVARDGGRGPRLMSLSKKRTSRRQAA